MNPKKGRRRRRTRSRCNRPPVELAATESLPAPGPGYEIRGELRIETVFGLLAATGSTPGASPLTVIAAEPDVPSSAAKKIDDANVAPHAHAERSKPQCHCSTAIGGRKKTAVSGSTNLTRVLLPPLKSTLNKRPCTTIETRRRNGRSVG